jgi:hypothetical protein
MLTELYIEALLADEALADEVWVLWDAGVITDELAATAWYTLATSHYHRTGDEPRCLDPRVLLRLY